MNQWSNGCAAYRRAKMPEDSGSPEADPYVDGMPKNWPDEAPRLIRPVQRENKEWVLEGTCPRCRHKITKELGPTSGIGFGEGQDRVLLRCNCAYSHPGGRPGCGAVGYLTLRARG
jgi:hypothetical protein